MNEQMRECVARAIWSIRRDDEDRCDMELEDMGRDHSVWREADAVLAWLRSQGEPVAWARSDTVFGWKGQLMNIAWMFPSDKGLINPIPLYAAPQSAIPDGWQPIETMPKDLEPFDVWSARNGRIPDCVDGVTTYGKRRGIVFQSGYDSDGPVMDLIEDATHWMRVAAPEQK